MKTAMILAAGRGERLKPLTDTLPKPMCLLRGKPLIAHHVENLANAGFEKIIINHAWLGGKMRQYLGNGAAFGLEIHYTAEPPGGLETAGGIINALPLLGKNPFAVINGDIYTDYDFSCLDLPQNAQACLILIPKNPTLHQAGDFGLENNRVSNDDKNYTFAGIACYRPEIFHHLPFGRYSLTPLLCLHVDQEKVYGEIHSGHWFDIGSLERYQFARRVLLDV